MRQAKADPATIIAGAVITLIGAYFAWRATGYGLGTARAMRAGYFPFLVGGLTVASGLALMAAGLMRHRQQVRIAWRPLFGVVAGIAAFALLLRTVGLVPATMVSVLLSTRAHPDTGLGPALALGAALSFALWLIFIVGLRQPIRAFAWGMPWIF